MVKTLIVDGGQTVFINIFLEKCIDIINSSRNPPFVSRRDEKCIEGTRVGMIIGMSLLTLVLICSIISDRSTKSDLSFDIFAVFELVFAWTYVVLKETFVSLNIQVALLVVLWIPALIMLALTLPFILPQLLLDCLQCLLKVRQNTLHWFELDQTWKIFAILSLPIIFAGYLVIFGVYLAVYIALWVTNVAVGQWLEASRIIEFLAESVQTGNTTQNEASSPSDVASNMAQSPGDSAQNGARPKMKLTDDGIFLSQTLRIFGLSIPAMVLVTINERDQPSGFQFGIYFALVVTQSLLYLVYMAALGPSVLAALRRLGVMRMCSSIGEALAQACTRFCHSDPRMVFCCLYNRKEESSPLRTNLIVGNDEARTGSTQFQSVASLPVGKNVTGASTQGGEEFSQYKDLDKMENGERETTVDAVPLAEEIEGEEAHIRIARVVRNTGQAHSLASAAMTWTCPLCSEVDCVASIVLRPCSHKLCLDCFTHGSLNSRLLECPLCQTPITSFLGDNQMLDPC